MAEASEYQRQKFIELYGELDTAALQGLSQADFDSIVPPQAQQVEQPVAAPPAPPQPKQKVQEPKAPAPKVEATPEPPRTSFSFEDMQVPSDFEPAGPPLSLLPEGLNLGERVRRPIGPPPEIKAIEQRVSPAPLPLGVSEEAVMERSKDPFGAPDAERMERERARAERILKTPMTTGGEPAFLTGLGEEAVRAFESPLVRALGPQQIATPSEARELDQFEFDLAQATASQLLNENTMALRQAEAQGDRALIDELVKRREELKGDIGGDAEFLARKNINRDKVARGEQLLPFGSNQEREAGLMASPAITERATDLAKRAFTTRQAGGRIVEAPSAYTMRLSAAPLAGLAGGVEAAVTDRPAFGEEGTIPESIREGETFMIKGAEVADIAAEAAGLPESYKETGAGKAGRYLGGAGGLAVDLMFPIIPGSAAARGAVTEGVRAAAVARQLGVPTRQALKTIGRQAVSGAGREVPFAGRYIFSPLGNDLTARTLTRFAEANADDVRKVLEVWQAVDRQARAGQRNVVGLAQFRKLSREDQVAILSEMANQNGLSFDDFQQLAAKFDLELKGGPDGFDISDTLANIISKNKKYYHRAALAKNLSPENAEKLALGIAISEDDVVRDIATIIIKRADDLPENAIPRFLRTEVEALPEGIQDRVRAFLQGQYESVTFGTLDEPGRLFRLDSLLEEPEVLKQVLYDLGNSRLRSTPSSLPNYFRASARTYVPNESRASFLKDIEDSPIPAFRDEFIAKFDEATGTSEVSNKTLQEIELLGSKDPTKTLPLKTRVTSTLSGGDIITLGELETKAAGTTKLTTKQYNAIIDDAVENLALRNPATKTFDDVATDVIKLRADEAPKMDLEVYKTKVLTPKEIAGGKFEQTAKVVGQTVLQEKPQVGSVISEEFVSEIGRKFGSMNEEFKMLRRQKVGEGMSPQDAWAATIVENYVPAALKESDVAYKEQAVSVMFRDYIAMLFGGHESMVQALNTTRRTQVLDNMVVSPAEMKQLIEVMMEAPILKKIQQDFVAKVIAGDNIGALNDLRNAHAILTGRPIQDLIADPNVLKTFYSNAKKLPAEVRILNKPYRGGARQDERGIFQIWNYAKETKPTYLVDDHLELLAIQYMTRRQAGILQEVYSDWARVYPELFPDTPAVKANIDKYRTLVVERLDLIERKRKGILSAEQLASDYVKARGVNEDLVQEMQRAYVDRESAIEAEYGMDLEDLELFADGGQTLDRNLNQQFRNLPPELKNSLKDKLDELYRLDDTLQQVDEMVADPTSIYRVDPKLEEDLAGPIQEYLKTVREVLDEQDFYRKAYVALAEDRLTMLGGSAEAANKYKELVEQMSRRIAAKIKKDVPTMKESINVDALIKKFGGEEEGAEAFYDLQDRLDTLGDLHERWFVRNFTFDNDHMSLSGVDAYINSIYPELRPETNALFYDTLKTSIRQAANNNLLVIRDGPLESVSVIPILMEETKGIKRQLVSKSGIEQLTRSMEELAISSTARSVSPDRTLIVEGADVEKLVLEGLEETLKIRGEIQASKAQRLFRVVGDVVGTPTSVFNDGRIASVAKGGVLGGQLLPNFRYHITNHLTAPAIVYSTLGGEYAARAVLFDTKTNMVMKTLTSNSNPRTGAPMDVTNKLGGFYKVPEQVVLRTPTGKVYTNYDIAQLVATSEIARSQASAELTRSVAKDIVSWSRINVDSSAVEQAIRKARGKDAIPANLKDSFRSGPRDFLQEAMGANFVGNRQMNMYSEMANLTDTQYRVKVLIKALEDGKAEGEAIQLAREALFDYGRLTQIERDYINKVFWFWTFRRESYRTVLKSMLSNPKRLRNAYLANGYFAEMDREYNFSTVDYTAYRPFLYLIDNVEMKQRYAMYGPATPQLQSMAELVDYVSAGVNLYNSVEDVNNAGTAMKNLIAGGEAVMAKGAEMSNPFVQTAIGLYLGVDVRREGKELGYYLDPRLMWYLQQDPQMWETFSSLIKTEVVEPEREIPGRGTYQGRQWRIKRGDTASVKAWFAIQQAMLGVGIYRNFRDYGPAFAGLAGIPEGEREIPIQLGGAPRGDGSVNVIENMLYTGGVITPITELNLQDKIEFNKRALNEKFE